MKGKQKVALVLLILLGLLVGVGALTWTNRVKAPETGLVQTVTREKSPVQTVKAHKQTLTEKLVATGTLKAEQDVVLAAEVAGQVKKVYKALGDACKKGELFVKLDPETYNLAVLQAKAAVTQAEVNLEYASRDWQRMEKLKKSEVATAQQIDGAEGAVSVNKAAVAQAKAAVALAARNLKETNVKCPFSGFIAERMVDPGAAVGPQTPLGRLVDTSRLRLEISVTSDKLSRLKVGQAAALSDPALPDTTYKGTVSRLGVAADPLTRTFPVEVELDDTESRLHAGQVVQAALAIQDYEDVLAVPAAAVHERGDETHVFTVTKDTAKKVPVSVVRELDDLVIIAKGLTVGDEVVVVGGSDLSDGAPIEVTKRLDGEAQTVAEAPAKP